MLTCDSRNRKTSFISAGEKLGCFIIVFCSLLSLEQCTCEHRQISKFVSSLSHYVQRLTKTNDESTRFSHAWKKSLGIVALMR